MISRKLRKLKRNPRLFFEDMLKNNRSKINKSFDYKNIDNGNFNYTVVSAVYGVEKYLNNYFKSITTQSLNFEKNITLIMVDDGSQDGSKKIIQEWCKKFPENIIYIYKENGGQASARNLGMKYAVGDWITFIDPDDTVDSDYFLNVDMFLAQEKYEQVALACCNYIFNIEGKGLSDRHPLKQRFEKGNRYLKISEMKNDFQMSVNSVFFNRVIIDRMKILSAENIKPNYEDGHFVARYLLNNNDKKIGFCQTAKYFYLKRDDASSALDGSMQDRRRYTEVIQLGYLSVLNIAKAKYGEIPIWLQNEILYELFWLIRFSLNNAHRLNFLSDNDKVEFKNLLMDCFKHIDKNTIRDFSLAGCWFFHKKGMLNVFKNHTTNFEISYLDKVNFFERTIRIRYYSTDFNSVESLTCDDSRLYPFARKTITHRFLDQVFIYEHILDFCIDNSLAESDISIFTNGMKSRLSIHGKQYHNPLSLLQINKLYNGTTISASKSFLDKINFSYVNSKKNKYFNAWLLMDRDTQADDNAEHMYQYISDNEKNINIFFILRKNSHDWNRLKNLGYKLISFGSREHFAALAWAEHIISSHADQYIVNQLTPKIRLVDNPIKYTFLQHGVIKDDLSGWLNRKPIDLFITTTSDEHLSIIEQGSNYKFTDKQVAMTGLARYDRLYNYAQKSIKKHILIMPTWRNGIVGKATGVGNDRDINKEFSKTEYAIKWKEFLHCPLLKKISKDENIEIIFFPHANINKYLHTFEIPEHIKIMSHSSEKSIQEIFSETLLLITDYSSVAFDLAYIHTPVIYYQFDKDSVFSTDLHIYKSGYFEYENKGFGPVCLDLPSVEKSINDLVNDKFSMGLNYSERIKETFTIREGKCCKRIFEKIKSLNTPQITSNENKYVIAHQEAIRAENAGHFSLAKTRYLYLGKSSNSNLKAISIFGSLKCAMKDGDIDFFNKNINLINNKTLEYFFLNILHLSYYEKWDEIFNYINENPNHKIDKSLYSIIIRTALEVGSKGQFLFMTIAPLMGLQNKMWRNYKNKNWNKLIENIDNTAENYYFLEQIKVSIFCNNRNYVSSEKLISELDQKITRWQYHRLFARMRASQNLVSKAQWHYNKSRINDKYELPLSDLNWLKLNEKSLSKVS